MNKKLIKTIARITCGLGMISAVPIISASCSCSNKSQDKLLIDITLDSINANFGSEITPTIDISGLIKTDTGESVSGVTFSCEGLQDQTGLTINETTGVISGTLTKKPTNPNFKIKFTAYVDGKSLEGYSNTFTITANPTKLVIDKPLDPINVNLDSTITPAIDISGLIKTDTGESVSGVTFACTGLPTGLSIDQSTGVISGIPIQIQDSTSYIVKFSCIVKEIPLEGSTEINVKVNGPQSIVCFEIEDQSIVVNETFSLGVADVKMVFDTGIETSLSSSDIASYELVDEGGQPAENTLPEGLSFNSNEGNISGTVTSLNYYAPMTYKIKITGSERIGSIVGYSNTFTLSMQNNPLPEDVYNIDTNNVLLGFKEGIDLSQYEDVCDTMQIPANVTSVNNWAFCDFETGPTIPSFITKLFFSENSNCSLIGNNAFVSWSSLTSVIFPINLKTIDSFAFAGCSLTSVTFPSSLTTIASSAFANCSSLTSVIFPSSLTTIGVCAFDFCINLSSITWDAWNGEVYAGSFNEVAERGTVTVTNQKDDAHNSAALLQYLIENGDLPEEGWTAA